ncbi:hypothetical protein GCM10020227_38710 [Streptomyces flavovirens]
MTVPTNPERLHPPTLATETEAAGVPPSPRLTFLRRRRLLIASASALGVGVVALVLVFPGLAAPIGTATGVVGAVVPLMHRVGRNNALSEDSADEP